MNVEVKERWVKALRSGKYRQGRQWLRSPSDEYCCLGVLCDLADRSEDFPGSFSWEQTGNRWTFGRLGAAPPLEVTRWADIPDHEIDHLVDMNDTDGDTFEQIADYIEVNL